MNLIERLGGYEKAKAKFRDNGSLHAERLKAALLEYRRKNNTYEKGDWVFYEITGCVGEFVDHIKLNLGYPYCMVDFGLCDIGLIMLKNIRHATDEDIKAGKRL